ncbi:MAG TPA: energy transducer TonB, partial [Nitrospira sp.]
LPEDRFQWDVSLVEEARSDSTSESGKSAMVPEQQPAKKPLPSRTQSMPEAVQPIKPLVSAAKRIETSQPTIESRPPTERKMEASQLREEPVGQRMVEVAETRAEPAAEAKESVAVAGLPEPVESQSVQQEPVAIASAHTPSTEVPISQAAPAPGHEAKADNRWLAESLWRRVAELKRYPNSARMNGQEGKVILKAVIRSDGYLADVSVQKSSGYSVLDAAAIEAVKLACPLYMKHAIGKPQIVVSLPIVYSLAN